MIKKVLFSLFLFFILPVFSLIQPRLFAQTVTPTPPPSVPFCFTAVRCDQASPKCAGDHVAVHTARLTVDPTDQPQPNSKVYVLDCLKAADGLHCTTGNQTLNDTLAYPPMPSSLGYSFDGFYKEDGVTSINQVTNTLMTNNAAQLQYSDSTPVSSLLWADHSHDTDRQWIGLSIAQPVPTINPQLGMGALQQTDIPKLDWTSALQKCVPINWDPDGVVFDSQSLEPIPGSVVTLTMMRANGSFTMVTPNDAPGGNIVNPYTVLEDGGFSFFVPDGTYELTPQIAGYKFPGISTLNTNYSKIYTDIYPSMTGAEIVEKGGPQHRDIPVDSTTGLPTHFPIKYMTYSYQSDKVSSVFVDGRVSHPLATINAYSVVPDPSNPAATIRYRLITTVQADKNGRFSLIVNQANLDSSKSEMFGEIEATKADFGASANDPYSTPALLKLNPILTYIQGQASSNGKTLADATVSIVYDGATKPIYTTQADSQGNFTIPTDFIPTLPYKIRYTSGGVTTSLTTTNFVTGNSANILTNKINLFYPRYSDPTINNKIKQSITSYNNQIKSKQNSLSSGTGLKGSSGFGTQGGTNSAGSGSNGQSGANGVGSANQPSTSKTVTFIVMVLLIIIVLGGVGAAGVYFIKRSQNPPPAI